MQSLCAAFFKDDRFLPSTIRSLLSSTHLRSILPSALSMARVNASPWTSQHLSQALSCHDFSFFARLCVGLGLALGRAKPAGRREKS